MKVHLDSYTIFIILLMLHFTWLILVHESSKIIPLYRNLYQDSLQPFHLLDVNEAVNMCPWLFISVAGASGLAYSVHEVVSFQVSQCLWICFQ